MVKKEKKTIPSLISNYLEKVSLKMFVRGCPGKRLKNMDSRCQAVGGNDQKTKGRFAKSFHEFPYYHLNPNGRTQLSAQKSSDFCPVGY